VVNQITQLYIQCYTTKHLFVESSISTPKSRSMFVTVLWWVWGNACMSWSFQIYGQNDDIL